MKPLIRTYSPVASIFVAFTLAGASAVHAANDVWIGNTDANFGTLSNWTGSVSPNNNTPVFGVAGTSGTTLNNDIVGATYAGLTFNSGASAFTIGGNSFTLTGNIANNSTSTQTINTAINLSGARTFAATSGQLVFGGNITGSPNGSWTLTPTNKITLGGTNSLTMSANFAGLLINAGAGGVDITGSTTITGAAGNAQSGYMNIMGTTTVAIKSGGSLTINGTTNTTPGGIVGQNTAGTSTLSVENGGSFNYGGNVGLAFGNNIATAIGVFEVSGNATITAGSTTATDQRSLIILGRDSATGTVNLNSGGVLATGRNFIRDGSGTADVSGSANFNFKGGTLKALANQTDWLNSSTKNTNQLALTSVTAANTSTIDSNGFSVAINSNISGAGGFNIISSTGAGTVTFGGANSYTGATTIGSGTLALASTGSLSSTQLSVSTGATFDVSAVSGYAVGSGVTLTNNGTVTGSVTVDGTLKGSGTFNNAVTVNGSLNPGNSPGTVTFTNGLALAATSNLGWELIANTDTGAGTNFDQVLVTGGALSIADGATLNLAFGGTVDFADSFWTSDRTWTVIDFAGNGEEGALTLGSISGGVGDFSEFGSFSTSNDNGNQVLTWTAVPEPTAALLGGIGLLGLLRRRRVA